MTSRKRAKADPEMALVKNYSLLVHRVGQTGLMPANKWLIYKWALERLVVKNGAVSPKWLQHIKRARLIAEQEKELFELSLSNAFVNLLEGKNLEQRIWDGIRERSKRLRWNAEDQLLRIRNRRLRQMCQRALAESFKSVT